MKKIIITLLLLLYLLPAFAQITDSKSTGNAGKAEIETKPDAVGKEEPSGNATRTEVHKLEEEVKQLRALIEA